MFNNARHLSITLSALVLGPKTDTLYNAWARESGELISDTIDRLSCSELAILNAYRARHRARGISNHTQIRKPLPLKTSYLRMTQKLHRKLRQRCKIEFSACCAPAELDTVTCNTPVAGQDPWRLSSAAGTVLRPWKLKQTGCTRL